MYFTVELWSLIYVYLDMLHNYDEKIYNYILIIVNFKCRNESSRNSELRVHKFEIILEKRFIKIMK